MTHAESNSVSPALEALHAARTALTVASGRIELAQRHATRDALDRVMNDLAAVPAQLEHLAAAVDLLAAAAACCESDDLLSLVAAPKDPSYGRRASPPGSN